MEHLNEKIQAQFEKMQQTGKLFRAEISGQQIWDLYLNSFEKKHNPIFRDPNSSTHNCNHCNNFVRRYGNIVAIDNDLNIMTIFDVEADEEYANPIKVLTQTIRNSKISEVFFETYQDLNELPYESCNKSQDVYQLGVDSNVKRYTKEEAEKYGIVKANEIRTFHHLHLHVSKSFVDKSGSSVESIMAEYRDAKNVFQRAMETIPLDTLNLVKDLINQGSLLDGTAHLYKIEQIIPLKKEYDKLAKKQKDNWCWLTSYNLKFAGFRNELIGKLCVELAEGEELNKACQSWNYRVDPKNFMKATAPITKRQIEEAKKFVEENGYVESFNRRFATIDDIKVSEILHSNVGDNKIKSVSIFDNVKSTSTRHKRSEFDGVEEVSIEKFMKDILPNCTSVEAYLQNNHDGNMVSLTTANDKNSKPIFKWSNNYSWTFNGNLAGKSQIKEAVKSAGGKVDGVLRFSIIWNENGKDESDLDAWCQQPDKELIGFNTGFRKDEGDRKSSCSGQLDLDKRYPQGKLAVENIYFENIKRLKNGTYSFWVHQWDNNNSLGFKAEIEFNGETFYYEYNKPLSHNEKIMVADVTFKDGQFTIKHLIPETAVSSKEIYGLETNQFHKVNLICLSPNHWDGNSAGNKHYFFMLDGCKCPTSIRSFHNENLIGELVEYRKVLEVLGATNMIEPTNKQLSGLGFNSTVSDELIVKLQGSFKRMVKIKFNN